MFMRLEYEQGGKQLDIQTDKQRKIIKPLICNVDI